jgi:phosphatidylglycerol---prolipoprotein diacylglyceryl transferase
VHLDPLIPYLEIPNLTIVPGTEIALKPFGALVATGVWVGAVLVVRQARRLGVDRTAMLSFALYVMVSGFCFAHALDVLWYYPGRVLREPLSILHMWEGLSSFGGFTGAVIGGLLWKWRHRSPMLPYADLMAWVFPFGWIFGRMGCSIAHDHPGLPSDVWFAVRYPGGGRLDLGLLELVFTIPLAVLFALLGRKPRPWGFYAGLLMTLYAPVRFGLDFLRARSLPGPLGPVDPRYFELTPAQWGCIVALGAGIWLSWQALARAGDPEAVRPPTVPRAGQG